MSRQEGIGFHVFIPSEIRASSCVILRGSSPSCRPPHLKHLHPRKLEINLYGIRDLQSCPPFSDYPLSLESPLAGTLRRWQWRIDRSLHSQDSFNHLLVHPHHKMTDFRREVLTRFRGQEGTHYLEAQNQVEGGARASSGKRDYRRIQLSSRFTLVRDTQSQR